MSNSEFQKIFEDYGGDYQNTMNRFMRNEDLYLRFLRMLPQDPSVTELGAALDAGDLEAAFTAAHTLKGMSGNMGLTPLYEAVCRIVGPLRQKDQTVDYAALYQDILTEYRRTEPLLAGLDKETGAVR